MDSNSEEELRRELEETKRRLSSEQNARESENSKADAKAWAREEKASANTASIVFFGAIGIIFVFALFGKTF
jgi:hypothetical protein